MNGLEAIELMKQGKMVKRVDLDIKFRIKNNCVEGMHYDNAWSEHWAFNVNEDYEEYIEPKPLTGWERVDYDLKFHYISNCEETNRATENHDRYDDDFYENANYFSTKEKAEEIHFKQTLFRKLQRFSDENGGNEIDWSDGTEAKYSIFYKHRSNDLCIDVVWNDQHPGIVYFASRKVADKAVELFHDDLIKYFTHDWN